MEDSDGTMDENHGIVQLWACAESLKETKDAV